MSIVIVQGGGMYDEGTATAGTPGAIDANHRNPSNFTDLQGTLASPLTEWTEGQHIVLGDTTKAWWSGTAWVVGQNIAPTLGNQAPPNTGTHDVAYAGYTFTAATGDSPITWTVTSGALPDGITLSTAGVLAGTPTVAAVFTFKVTATNPAGSVETANKTITIS